MNNTQTIAITKYLYTNLENHLKAEEEKRVKELNKKYSDKLTLVKKLFKKAQTASKLYDQEMDILKATINNNDKTLLITGYSGRIQEPQIGKYNPSCSFKCLNNSTSYRCTQEQLEKAKEASAKIDRFIIQMMLKGDITPVDDFLSELLKTI